MRLDGLGITLMVCSAAAASAHGARPEPRPGSVAFAEFTASSIVAGCGGAAGDWEALRRIDDPREGSIRSRGVEPESCLILKGLMMDDGAVTAWIRASGAPAGFALRHRDSDHYLGIYLDLAVGVATAVEWDGQQPTRLGTALFEPPPGGAAEAVAAVRGSRFVAILDGRRILDGDGVASGAGEVGLLASPLSVAEFQDVSVTPWLDADPVVFTPVTPARARVGKPAAIRFVCHKVGTSRGEEMEACPVALGSGSLPDGLRLRGSGLLAGTPARPGDFSFLLKTRRRGAPALIPSRVRVEAVSWPRFPLDPKSRIAPALAVLYTPDDIGQNVTLEGLGHPERFLFRLHRDHPRLKITLAAAPANRYLGESTLADHPVSVALWRSLALGSPFEWIELAGHGYTHSPEGDSNLDHHEFSTKNTGCNLDHTAMSDPAYCLRRLTLAREACRAAGISDDRLVVMRFPGSVDTPQALGAALEAGFIAVLGRRHGRDPGREWWIPAADAREILEIEDVLLLDAFARSRDLEAALAAGRMAPVAVTKSAEFRAAVARGRDLVDRIAAGGGILNLTDHWWDTFTEIGGAQPRYLLLDAVLRDIEERYVGRTWYPGARDLALWLDARRSATVSWREEPGGVHVEIEPPPHWGRLSLTGLGAASLVVSLPARWEGVGGVRIREGLEEWRSLDPSLYWMTPEGLAVTFPLRGRVHLHLTRRPA